MPPVLRNDTPVPKGAGVSFALLLALALMPVVASAQVQATGHFL